jgi:predicted O-linked N-acetylglucosamine transferase (SPINDLY family)
MGLPVLTCVGDTFSARVAGSLLTSSNISELITYSLQEYESKALYLSQNPAVLGEIKQKLITSKLTSALFNTNHFVKSLEDIYQSMRKQCLFALETSDKAAK